MGAIVAYKGTIDSAGRQAGMQALGGMIINGFSGWDSNGDRKISNREAAVMLAGVLQAALKDGLQLYFENFKSPKPPGYRIANVALQGGSNKIDVGLVNPADARDTATLVIPVKADDGTQGNKFVMDVVFPEFDDVLGVTYLQQAADDVYQIYPTGNPKDYLAAVTFLSRCK